MVVRDELLSVVDCGDLEKFISFIKTCKTDGVDLTQTLNACSKKQLDKMWEGVQKTCATKILSTELSDDEEHVEMEMQKLSEVLECVVTLANANIHQSEPHVPPCLFFMSVALHEMLLTMPEKTDKLKNSTAKLFEDWWHKKLTGREDLILNTLIYLLQRSLRPNGSKEGVRRVWLLRDALSTVDLSNESSVILRDLLINCVINIGYLKCDEGCKFLGFVLSLNDKLTDDMHKTMKNHIPTAPRFCHEKFGMIYYRGWQKSTGATLQKIETDCLQDLMYHAVHASKVLGPCIRPVLSYIHKQKKQEKVDEMLLRLYRPILWRSFKVASPLVRSNAALLLIDAFPLNDPELGVEESDNLIQKQFNIFLTLLYDPVPSVRSITVNGIFRIMNVYWEIIPSDMLKKFLSKMIQDMVWDSSSSEVRENVIKGFSLLLDNPLSHPVLKLFLPELRNHIHDVAERVRIAMIDLLLKVKPIRSIKYWHIVTVEGLLARMEIDSAPVIRRIMRLIFSSFLPVEKPSEVQLNRCITLIETNPAAAREFFHNTPKHLSTEDTANFMEVLARCVLQCIRAERKKNSIKENSSDTTQGESETEQNEDQEETEDVTVNNIKVMRGLIEAMVILWTVIAEDLHKKENKDIWRNLVKTFAIAVPEMLKTFEDSSICSALVRLAGFLPPNNITTVSCGSLSKLRHMTEDSSVADYGCFLEAMCSWGKVSDVFNLVEDWITEELNSNSQTEHTAAKTEKKSRKSVSFKMPDKAQPLLGLDFVSYMLRHPVCQPFLLTNCVDDLQQLRNNLKNVLKRIEQVVNTEKEGDNQADTRFIESSLTLYCKLTVLLNDLEGDEGNAMRTFEELFTWAEIYLVPCLKKEDEEPQSSRKRTVPAADIRSLALNVIQTLLSMSGDMILIGIGDVDFHTHLTHFCVVCIQADYSLTILPNILNCLYQITEQVIIERIANEASSFSAHAIPGFLGKLFVTMAMCLQRNKDQATKMISGVTSHMSEILGTLYRSPVIDGDILQEIMANVITAMLAELSSFSQQMELEECGNSLKELPPLCSCLTEAVCKKHSITKYFTTELSTCLESGAVTELHHIHGATHLLSTLAHSKLSLPGMKECWTALHQQISKLKQTLADTSVETDEDVLKSVLSKLQDCQSALNVAGPPTGQNASLVQD